MKKYLLNLPMELFRKVRVEAAKKNMSMRNYIVLALDKAVKEDNDIKKGEKENEIY